MRICASGDTRNASASRLQMTTATSRVCRTPKITMVEVALKRPCISFGTSIGKRLYQAVYQGGGGHLEYLIAQVEYPQWDELAAHAEHPRPEAIGVIKRFLGTDEAHADLHGKPVHEALSVLGAEGWELVAIDHPMPSAGPSAHYYVFKRVALGRGSTG